MIKVIMIIKKMIKMDKMILNRITIYQEYNHKLYIIRNNLSKMNKVAYLNKMILKIKAKNQ